MPSKTVTIQIGASCRAARCGGWGLPLVNASGGEGESLKSRVGLDLGLGEPLGDPSLAGVEDGLVAVVW